MLDIFRRLVRRLRGPPHRHLLRNERSGEEEAGGGVGQGKGGGKW